MTAQYKLLQPHYVNNIFLDQGSIVTEGVQIPTGWIPTLQVDPLNAAGLTAFYNAGPRGLGWESMNEFGAENYNSISQVPPFIRPITYWVQLSPGAYSLTGLGILLPPVMM